MNLRRLVIEFQIAHANARAGCGIAATVREMALELQAVADWKAKQADRQDGDQGQNQKNGVHRKDRENDVCIKIQFEDAHRLGCRLDMVWAWHEAGQLGETTVDCQATVARQSAADAPCRADSETMPTDQGPRDAYGRMRPWKWVVGGILSYSEITHRGSSNRVCSGSVAVINSASPFATGHPSLLYYLVGDFNLLVGLSAFIKLIPQQSARGRDSSITKHAAPQEEVLKPYGNIDIPSSKTAETACAARVASGTVPLNRLAAWPEVP
ncbi:hypothetical protein K488DRAFT_74822 [Vararia minispora EC-137]|uniref:Uncharacterized protein n=1 Tax=Vararia minispora EC-137 TaxID=1314806 RepID=A0ACB8Q5N0_9AGAM|nr:hypothetical protein K488DRAFT_74822 [Vararia minispora EC-137]